MPKNILDSATMTSKAGILTKLGGKSVRRLLLFIGFGAMLGFGPVKWAGKQQEEKYIKEATEARANDLVNYLKMLSKQRDAVAFRTSCLLQDATDEYLVKELEKIDELAKEAVRETAETVRDTYENFRKHPDKESATALENATKAFKIAINEKAEINDLIQQAKEAVESLKSQGALPKMTKPSSTWSKIGKGVLTGGKYAVKGVRTAAGFTIEVVGKGVQFTLTPAMKAGKLVEAAGEWVGGK